MILNNVEKRLAEEKKRLDDIQAPEELEARLKHALNSTTPTRKKRFSSIWKMAAVALFILVIIGYHHNAFAYYGKKLLGFDEVISGTLKELNDEGMGQIIDKRTTLEDGTNLIIDGIMTDANQLIMYYTLANPDGLGGYDTEHFRPFNITGLLTNSDVESDTSLMNENHTELKGMLTFEPVSPFSKKLTLHFWQELESGQMLDDSISFSYDPNKALKTEIKQAIRENVKVDKGEITFNSITASRTLTVIEGILNVDNFDRLDLGLHGIELIANGKPVEIIGSSSRSAIRGTKFDIRYDALPKQLDSLDLVIKEFVGYQLLQEKFPLASFGDESFMLDGKELSITAISAIPEGVGITIITDDDVMLDGVSIETGNEVIPLSTTVGQIQTVQEDGSLVNERTLVFNTSQEPRYLLIEGMHYAREYNEVIEIPVN